MKRESFQKGSVVLEPRVTGPGVWVFMYRDAEGKQRKKQIGTEDKLPTKAKAEKAAYAFRAEINDRLECVLFEDLVTSYETKDLPAVRSDTRASYGSHLKRLVEKWGRVRIDVMAKDMMGMQMWLKDLKSIPTKNRPPRPLSKPTKGNIHSVMQILFDCAIQWNYLPLARNPMELVKIKGPEVDKREITTITLEYYSALLADPELPHMVKVLIELAMCTGLRISEILGLRWEDVDWIELTIFVQRSVVGKDKDRPKSKASREYVPLHEDLAATLSQWKAAVPSVEGWLFGNIETGRPFWRGNLYASHLLPAGQRLGIESLGWHNFRHTYRQMLRDLGDVPLEVQQKLMRHASIAQTVKYGKGSMLKHTRPANAKLVAMLPKSPKPVVEKIQDRNKLG